MFVTYIMTEKKIYGYMTSLLFDGEFYCGATAYIYSSLLVVTTFLFSSVTSKIRGFDSGFVSRLHG